MSKEFIEKRIGSTSIAEARRQQEQLSYFTQSEIQKEITTTYVQKWAERNYAGSEEFLTWVKMLFKADNFMSFFKYFRKPLASARLVNNRVKPQLERVFFSENAYSNYTIKGNEVETPEELDAEDFNKWMFNALLFRHNDILVTDLKDTNEAFRQLVSIENIVAIESTRSVIHRLAYTASITTLDEIGNPKEVKGFLFMDDKDYIFYDEKLNPILTVPHDLGECPADYISDEPFAEDDIVRKSMFSYVREELEEYVFLKTLQRMQEPNGALPIVTQLQTRKKDKSDKDIKGVTSGEPMQANLIGGQVADVGKEVTPKTGTDGILQAGTTVKVPMMLKDDGSLDMEAVKHFLNFFYIPVEALDYLNRRIKEIEQTLIIELLGETNQNGERKNELEVRSGFVSAEDKIRGVSKELSRIRTLSDFKFLALQHGRDSVQVEVFYGSDFFLESENELYDLFDKSPNPMERKNIIIKLVRNRNRFNPKQAQREVILNHLMPYVADKDFIQAVESLQVNPETFQYQTRFSYWIGIFEATYGDILIFWESLGTDQDSTKLMIINNLILEIIINSKAIVPVEPPAEGEE